MLFPSIIFDEIAQIFLVVVCDRLTIKQPSSEIPKPETCTFTFISFLVSALPKVKNLIKKQLCYKIYLFSFQFNNKIKITRSGNV